MAEKRNYKDALVATVTAAILVVVGVYTAGMANLFFPVDDVNFLGRSDRDLFVAASSLKRAWEELREGQIAYEPARTMRQGERESVRVRIAEGQTIETADGFVEEVLVERTKISDVMSAELLANEEDFRIDPISTEEQALVGKHVDWVWRVTPLRSGDLELTLRVTAKIDLENTNVYRDMLLKTAQIHVVASPNFTVKTFWERNWKWILGSLGSLAALVAGLLAWVRKRFGGGRERAGF